MIKGRKSMEQRVKNNQEFQNDYLFIDLDYFQLSESQVINLRGNRIIPVFWPLWNIEEHPKPEILHRWNHCLITHSKKEVVLELNPQIL